MYPTIRSSVSTARTSTSLFCQVSWEKVYNTPVSLTFDKLDGLKGPSLTTCPAQYDIIPVSTVPEEPRRGGMMPLRPQVPMQHALSMTQATDKEAFEGRHAANDLEVRVTGLSVHFRRALQGFAFVFYIGGQILFVFYLYLVDMRHWRRDREGL